MNPATHVKLSEEVALWDRYAHYFPVREHLIYLNHAAVAPLCKPAADAMKHLADDCTQFSSRHYKDCLDTYGPARGGREADRRPEFRDRATVVMGLDWQAGDRIVAFLEEFPANLYPWNNLEEKGIAVRGFRWRTRSTKSPMPPAAPGCLQSALCSF